MNLLLFISCFSLKLSLTWAAGSTYTPTCQPTTSFPSKIPTQSPTEILQPVNVYDFTGYAVTVSIPVGFNSLFVYIWGGGGGNGCGTGGGVAYL